MNNYNGSDLIIGVLFAMSPQLGVIGPEAQDLMISFILGEGETFPQFHLGYLHIRSEIFLLQDKI